MSGRKKGQKNLKRVGKRYENEHGVQFTEREKKQLESLVNSVNRKRKKIMTDKKLLDTRAALGVDPDFVFGLHSEKNLWGTGADTLLTKNRSKSLQRFKTKEEFKTYMKDLRRLSDVQYVEKRIKMAQKNKIKALESVFGGDAKEMVKGLRRLSPEEYQKVLSNHSLPSINYMYSDEEYDNALEKVKSMYEKIEQEYDLKNRRHVYVRIRRN